jgi:hypothetical protein
MVRNGKEPENPHFSLVAATLEKAITYVSAESPFRNAEVRAKLFTVHQDTLLERPK